MNTLTLQVNNSLAVNILPNQVHEFLMTSKEVAIGYGVSDRNIRLHITEHSDELLEGKHFLKGGSFSSTLTGTSVRNPHTNLQPHQTFWTKRGIVRLGFFIKSERAKQFRDWAEDLVIFATDNKQQLLEARILELERKLIAFTPETYQNTENKLPVGITGLLTSLIQLNPDEIRQLQASKLYTPTEVNQLARAAGWLRLINNIDVKQARQMGFSSIETLRNELFKCCLNEQMTKPAPLVKFKKGIITNERVLYRNAIQYKAQGIKCLIHAGVGNTNRKKNGNSITWVTNITVNY